MGQRPLCVTCKTNLAERQGTAAGYRSQCGTCRRPPGAKRVFGEFKNIRRSKRRLGLVCESCGFVPEVPAQIHLDHIDGNHSNNTRENLQALCANCHALKTYRNRDWAKKVYLGEVEEPPLLKLLG